MRKLWEARSVLGVGISMMIAFASTSASAATHVIVGTKDTTWQAETPTQHSTTNGDPLVVEVKKGDTIEILIPFPFLIQNRPHGFVTIDKKGTESPNPALGLVLACGEDPTSKPTAVLREIGCVTGTPSNFGDKPGGFVGSLKLEVKNNFQAETNFWCSVHKGIMWGTIKLKP
jgi:hypothetical protein